MPGIGEIAHDLDADREAAALPAGVRAGVMIFLSTRMEHLEAPMGRGIAHLRGRPAAVPTG